MIRERSVLGIAALGLIAAVTPDYFPRYDNRVPPRVVDKAERDAKRERRKAKLARRAARAGHA